MAGAGRASRRRLPRRPLPLSLSLAHTLSYSIYFAALERGRRKPGGAGAEGGKVAVPGRCLLSPDEPPRVCKKSTGKKKIKEKEKKKSPDVRGNAGGPRCGRPNLGVSSPRECAGVGWVRRRWVIKAEPGSWGGEWKGQECWGTGEGVLWGHHSCSSTGATECPPPPPTCCLESPFSGL